MAEAHLAAAFEDLSVTGPSMSRCLPFSPVGEFSWLQPKLEEVDRYLFRLYDKHSDGSTDDTWVKSRDAHGGLAQPDIFSKQGRNHRSIVAQALRGHLRWESERRDDNLVSWTSSLLVVLQYAMFRRQHFEARGLMFENMRICVVDTAKLPSGAFIRDTDLIKAFEKYDPSTAGNNLAALGRLRGRQRRGYSGYFNFGEYVSQGALYIKDNCSIVSMEDIVCAGLFTLRSEFESSESKPKSWANEVISLREALYWIMPPSPALPEEIEAALRIGNLYGESWKVPIALAFLALKPRLPNDGAIFEALRKLDGTDVANVQLSPLLTRVTSSDALPEVRQFDKLRRGVYEDALLRVALSDICRAKTDLQRALQSLRQVDASEKVAPINTYCDQFTVGLREVSEVKRDLGKELLGMS